MPKREVDSNITDQYLSLLFACKQKAFSEGTLIQAKKCILDYVGELLAGRRMLADDMHGYLSNLRDNQCRRMPLDSSKRVDIYSEVLLNGMCVHATELDDGHRFGMIHLGSTILSALFPVAQREDISGADFLSGVIVGYEAAIRLARSIQPSHRNRGYHATGTCGTIGAAVAIAFTLGYSREQTKSTLSLAVTSASGVLEIQEDGSELKSYNAGQAALNGFVSAYMGRVGFRGPTDILGGTRGFLSVMADEHDLERLTRNDQGPLEIEGVYFKPYASCRHSHPAIEAALNIRDQHCVSVSKISSVNVYTYEAAVKGHDHTSIQGINSAKMSIPYSVAVVLVTGRAGLEEFSECYICNEEILELADKVAVYSDPELTLLSPERRSAVVEVTTKDNAKYQHRIDFPKGEPENAMTTKDIEEKFASLAAFGGKSERDMCTIIDSVWAIETQFEGLIKVL